jgi:hypothetical protein
MLTKCHIIVRAISPGCNQVTLEHHSGTTDHSEGNEQWMLTYEQRLIEQSHVLDRMNQMLKNLHQFMYSCAKVPQSRGIPDILTYPQIVPVSCYQTRTWTASGPYLQGFSTPTPHLHLLRTPLLQAYSPQPHPTMTPLPCSNPQQLFPNVSPFKFRAPNTLHPPMTAPTVQFTGVESFLNDSSFQVTTQPQPEPIRSLVYNDSAF